MSPVVGEVDPWALLDDHLPPALRAELEESLWRPIEARATLEVLREDPSFFEDPGRHPAMFADHGVMHVRDVAAGLVRLVKVVDGVLLPARPITRMSLIQTWGVALAYLHDVGMVDMSRVGRRTHALHAAHLAFAGEVDALVEHLLSPGPVRDSLDVIEQMDPFGVPLGTVVREVLSLAAAHSKSTVPAEVLTDPAELARVMRGIVFTSMADHRAAAGAPAGDAGPAPWGHRGVDHPSPANAYGWLTAAVGPKADFVDDVIDAVRALRVADVLRQRGTALRTSGGFEVFFNSRTGRAVCTLRSADGHSAYVLTYDDHRGAGEANIKVARVTPRGDLRIAFHRGSFADSSAARRAAESIADAVLDIWADVIPAFRAVTARGLVPPARAAEQMLLQLERPADDPAFADLVRDVVCAEAPELSGRVHVVHDLEGATRVESARYELAEPVEPWGSSADEVVARLAEHGSDTSGMDREHAFTEVRLATVRAGEVLVEQGSFPAFVYVPLTPGLVVRPLGGYATAELHPWVPLGATGAIRRASRNADILAEREVDVLMVPSELYVTSWLRPLEPHQLRERLVSHAVEPAFSTRPSRGA